ncbi:hypothetical protein [Ferrovum myxofaciens]|uniref:hypothetical protein n=1 Tax=Ferrovum myxofaciens TaxID=416213 RepID=UPI0023568908|nr:hypothetical protein [Ferrovum myxofaciens]
MQLRQGFGSGHAPAPEPQPRTGILELKLDLGGGVVLTSPETDVLCRSQGQVGFIYGQLVDARKSL